MTLLSEIYVKRIPVRTPEPILKGDKEYPLRSDTK